MCHDMDLFDIVLSVSGPLGIKPGSALLTIFHAHSPDIGTIINLGSSQSHHIKYWNFILFLLLGLNYKQNNSLKNSHNFSYMNLRFSINQKLKRSALNSKRQFSKYGHT